MQTSALTKLAMLLKSSSLLGRISLLIQNIDDKNLFLFRKKKKKQGFSPLKLSFGSVLTVRQTALV